MNSRVITTAATARAKLSAFTAPWDEQTGRTGVLMLTNGIQVFKGVLGRICTRLQPSIITSKVKCKPCERVGTWEVCTHLTSNGPAQTKPRQQPWPEETQPPVHYSQSCRLPSRLASCQTSITDGNGSCRVQSTCLSVFLGVRENLGRSLQILLMYPGCCVSQKTHGPQTASVYEDWYRDWYNNSLPHDIPHCSSPVILYNATSK